MSYRILSLLQFRISLLKSIGSLDSRVQDVAAQKEKVHFHTDASGDTIPM